MYDIFDDYMGTQYREGIEDYKNGISRLDLPYDLNSEAGNAWLAGFDDEHIKNQQQFGEYDVTVENLAGTDRTP